MTPPRKSEHKKAVQAAQKALQTAQDAMVLALAAAPKPKSFLARWGKMGITIIAPICALLGAWFTLPPKLKIELGGVLDPHQPFQTVFVVRNVGSLSAHNVRFGCDPKAAAITVGWLGAYTAPVAKISAGGEVTKTCLVETGDVSLPATLTISATYKLPLIPIHRTDLAVFDVVKTAAGTFFLTPNMGTDQNRKLSGFEIDVPGKPK